MAGPRAPALRRRRARAAARGRNHPLEARLAHPAFDSVRPWLSGDRSLDRLNDLSQQRKLRTERGLPVRFVPPRPRDSAYELKVYETGEVETRADNPHDYFNALAWLAFPRSKARINAMHAAEIPLEGGRRGPLRDLLTVVDEGGALVQCDDAHLVWLLNEMRWKELFWDHRDAVASRMRVLIFGHASLEQALAPWPGITCKAIIAPTRGHPDAQIASWLGGLRAGARPRDLGPLPVFGLPGWHPAGERATFYEDARYFRPQQPSR